MIKHIWSLLLLYALVLIMTCSSCDKLGKETVKQNAVERDTVATKVYNEAYRPQIHFSPPRNWMNDPNGMVFHKGIYHLFYQYYPEDIVWGPMHWAHATSKDLVHWKNQGVKLYPDNNGYIFSGSAVVDQENSSGLGTTDNPPLVAIFTYHDPEGDKAGRNDFQTQGIAYSINNGESWEMYKNNPVLKNPGIRDFRDPKVIWHEESKRWIMVLAVADHVSFYSSENLINWNKLSDFGFDIGAHGGVWECPDLFPMLVEGTEDSKWILLVSINPGGPNGGSATQYFVGNFDGQKFSPDDTQTRWIDQGADNYAGVTFSNTGKQRIFMGWMSNWDYAQQTPTKNWRSAMTLPRILSLSKTNSNYYLSSRPHPNIDTLIEKSNRKDDIVIKDPYLQVLPKGEATELRLKTKLNQNLTLKLSNEKNESISLELDPLQQKITLDRRKSGLISFSEKFGDKIHSMSYQPEVKISDIRIFIDRSSIEVFIDDGKYVMTEQVFPSGSFDQLEIKSGEPTTINQLIINSLNSIWNYE